MDVAEVIENATEEKAKETVDAAKEIAAEIVDTAERMASKDVYLVDMLAERTDALFRRLDDIEGRMIALDEKINGVFDSMALLDAMLSRLVDLETEEKEERKEAGDQAVEVKVEGDNNGEIEIIPEETAEVSEPQKRGEKKSRKWL